MIELLVVPEERHTAGDPAAGPVVPVWVWPSTNWSTRMP
jgi:hypothetical protein